MPLATAPPSSAFNFFGALGCSSSSSSSASASSAGASASSATSSSQAAASSSSEASTSQVTTASSGMSESDENCGCSSSSLAVGSAASGAPALPAGTCEVRLPRRCVVFRRGSSSDASSSWTSLASCSYTTCSHEDFKAGTSLASSCRRRAENAFHECLAHLGRRPYPFSSARRMKNVAIRVMDMARITSGRRLSMKLLVCVTGLLSNLAARALENTSAIAASGKKHVFLEGVRLR
mmetsp:Transcript_21693/g.48378  ORF Transcript_21693/g.48378 Transcript_21693/m.48378 type:complete len:236 (-) Transcript_21693:35-742(-)